MKLFTLLKNIKCRTFGSLNLEISGLYHSDELVRKGGLFFCLNGENYRGADFAKVAVEKGAVAVVCETEIDGLRGITQILVKNTRKTMALIAANFYGNPSKQLKIIGVTGTNGKTTTTHIIKNLLEAEGKSCGVIGTNGVFFGRKKIESNMTTPDPIELHAIFKKFTSEKIEYVVMEVSAHACYLEKLAGIKFEAMIFTNLTEDHLDFFHTMENYFGAKKKIFDKSYSKNAIVNIDDDYGKNLAKSINSNLITYAISNKADYVAHGLRLKSVKQYFCFDGQCFSSQLLGEFNVYNLISAIACMKVLGFKLENLQQKIENIAPIDGRFNLLEKKGKLFIVDYAHTPDGLEKVLRLAKNIAKSHKLICLFGCGGNRETQKRSKMGEISSKNADLTIISSDNPRFEDRLAIVKDIEKGMCNGNYKIILDRSEAIKFADKVSLAGDVILVAGKGAEDYIDELGVKKPYSDFEEILNLE